MKLLLDTDLLLWAAGKPDRLPAEARTLIGDPRNEPVFSSVSLWEIATKRGLGRSDFQVDARLLRRGLLDNGYLELAITGEHAVATDGLPPLRSWPSTPRRFGRFEGASSIKPSRPITRVRLPFVRVHKGHICLYRILFPAYSPCCRCAYGSARRRANDQPSHQIEKASAGGTRRRRPGR